LLNFGPKLLLTQQLLPSISFKGIPKEDTH
jgi:hypothetical protein